MVPSSASPPKLPVIVGRRQQAGAAGGAARLEQLGERCLSSSEPAQARNPAGKRQRRTALHESAPLAAGPGPACPPPPPDGPLSCLSAALLRCYLPAGLGGVVLGATICDGADAVAWSDADQAGSLIA